MTYSASGGESDVTLWLTHPRGTPFLAEIRPGRTVLVTAEDKTPSAPQRRCELSREVRTSVELCDSVFAGLFGERVRNPLSGVASDAF